MSLGLNAAPGATHHDEQETLGVPLLEVGTALGHDNSGAGETEAFIVRQALLEVLMGRIKAMTQEKPPFKEYRRSHTCIASFGSINSALKLSEKKSNSKNLRMVPLLFLQNHDASELGTVPDWGWFIIVEHLMGLVATE